MRRRLPFTPGISYVWWLRAVAWSVGAVVGGLVFGWAGVLLFTVAAEVALFAISLFHGRHLHH